MNIESTEISVVRNSRTTAEAMERINEHLKNVNYCADFYKQELGKAFDDFDKEK